MTIIWIIVIIGVALLALRPPPLPPTAPIYVQLVPPDPLPGQSWGGIVLMVLAALFLLSILFSR